MPVLTEQVNEQQTSVIEVERIEVKNKPVYSFFKRAFDIFASLIASVLLIVPIGIISVIIVSKDKGTPFYFQKRIGRNGKMIKVCKFRSMKIGADNLEKTLTPEQLEEYKKEYKLKDDPRLIGYKKAGDGSKCFGAKIRKMSIDELPQIMMNILFRGDMSIVGPRPILESELNENYTPAEQKALLAVKPGLTGYWQAYARNDAGYKDGERQKMELYYVHNRSFWLDIKIIFKTVGSVLKGRGAN